MSQSAEFQESPPHFALEFEPDQEQISNQGVQVLTITWLRILPTNQTAQPVRLVGYRIGTAEYWVATNRRDLSAEEIALIYKPRWEIEKFFGWWKQHLQLYHRLARSPYGFMMQIMTGLITYLLLAIYCQKHYQEKVSIHRVRELRLQIQNDM